MNLMNLKKVAKLNNKRIAKTGLNVLSILNLTNVVRHTCQNHTFFNLYGSVQSMSLLYLGLFQRNVWKIIHDLCHALFSTYDGIYISRGL